MRATEIGERVAQVNANLAHEWTAQDIADYNAWLDDRERESEEQHALESQFDASATIRDDDEIFSTLKITALFSTNGGAA